MAQYNPFANVTGYSGGANTPVAPAYTNTPTIDPYKDLYESAQPTPTSYQIKENDTFASIGAQLGLDEKQIQDSSKMLVPPPKGSFISLPRPGFSATPQLNSQRRNLINQGVPASVAAQIAGGGSPSTMPQPGAVSGGANSFTSGINVNLSEMTLNYQNQIINGVAPKAIPTQVLPSLGATPQSMAQAGYVLNSQNGMWELGGTGGAAPTNQPDPNSQVRSVFYSRSRGYVTPEVARLLDRKKRRRQEEQKLMVAGPGATNAGATPVNVLEVQLGSG
jgi:hypothetical protein